VQSLWEIDEAIVYVNLNKPWKAAVWLKRAYETYGFSISDNGESFESFRKQQASLGGQARRDKYQPLKDFVKEKVCSRNYRSRRNAAHSIKSEVIEKANELGIALSDMQAVITITKWLKELGLPANI
jgi:hypothetical protein